MQYIDMDNWPRKEHFDFFYGMDCPQFSICMNIDVTHFLEFVSESNLSFYYSMSFAVTHAVNKIENFRYRIREGKVILYDKVHPSFTDLNKGSDLFKFITVEMCENIHEFSLYAKIASDNQDKCFDFDPQNERDDLLFLTCIPWISFTQVSHPFSMDKNDSCPRISWGKYFRDGNKVLLPFSVQANHALVDGYHVGKYIDELQRFINNL